jgi:hypothetical protein
MDQYRRNRHRVDKRRLASTEASCQAVARALTLESSTVDHDAAAQMRAMVDEYLQVARWCRHAITRLDHIEEREATYADQQQDSLARSR